MASIACSQHLDFLRKDALRRGDLGEAHRLLVATRVVRARREEEEDDGLDVVAATVGGRSFWREENGSRWFLPESEDELPLDVIKTFVQFKEMGYFMKTLNVTRNSPNYGKKIKVKYSPRLGSNVFKDATGCLWKLAKRGHLREQPYGCLLEGIVILANDARFQRVFHKNGVPKSKLEAWKKLGRIGIRKGEYGGHGPAFKWNNKAICEFTEDGSERIPLTLTPKPGCY